MKPFIAVVFSTLLLGGCASMPYSELPSVNVTSVSLAPHSAGVLPNFLIGLRVVNPNRAALPLVGMSYSLEVEDARILTGAAGDLPQVPAYGNADIVVELSPDLFGSARLLGGLMSGRHEALDYRFTARLDVGGWRPDIRVEQTGRLDLGRLAQPSGYIPAVSPICRGGWCWVERAGKGAAAGTVSTAIIRWHGRFPRRDQAAFKAIMRPVPRRPHC